MAFKRYSNNERYKKTCDALAKLKFGGGVYHTEQTIFERLADEGITVKKEDHFFPYRCCFDFEAFLEKTGEQQGGKANLICKHQPLCVSVVSNVPGYDQANCLVSNGDGDDLIFRFMTYLNDISEASFRLLSEKFKPQLDILNEKCGNSSETSSTSRQTGEGCKTSYFAKLRSRFLQYLTQLPVLGFNSRKYDINLVKTFLCKYLAAKEDVGFYVKKGNKHMVFATENLKFLDIRNYLSPDASYEKWVKAYDCVLAKGKFCYEYLDGLDKLEETELPPRAMFFNEFKNEELSLEDYSHLQGIWTQGKMETLRDFLIWYNNLDVIPFLEAAEKMFVFYKNLEVDLCKDCISVPGVSLKYMFKDLQTYFTLFEEKDSDIYHTMHANLVGGPSIIFKRYAEKAKTKIRGGKPRQKILGYDANALYLWALSQPMPTKEYSRRQAEDDGKFKLTKFSKCTAVQWLEWEAHNRGIKIRHKGNNTEKRVGDRQLPVDGFAVIQGKPTVFEFQGCYFHFHVCGLNYNKDGSLRCNEKREKTPQGLQAETREKKAYIQSLGFDFVELYECDFLKQLKNDIKIRAFVNKMKRPLHNKYLMTEEHIISAVKSGDLFGFVECDIEVPDGKKEHFAEFPPIFKNLNLSRDDIGDFMRDFAIEHGIMPRPRRILVSSMFAHKMLFATPLIQWYLAPGLKVTKIYQTIEYTPDTCFEPFAEAVSNARREGDLDLRKAVIADTMKLLGNSVYGKTVTNKLKYNTVNVCGEEKARRLINSPFFRTLDCIDENTFEVSSAKHRIQMNLPYQIGFMVYQYAKLKMLQFYYDIFTEMLEEFKAERGTWLPREDTPEHAKFDKRQPGLFKLEFEGSGFIDLNSKTYYCFDESGGRKFSCKGVGRRDGNINKDLYLSVLQSKVSQQGENKGMRMFGNQMYSYLQKKDALTYFYPKRKVLEDGISTTYLDI